MFGFNYFFYPWGYILQILGNDPGLKAIPLTEPELAQSVGLVTQDRDPSAPLVRAFREAAAAFSVRNLLAGGP